MSNTLYYTLRTVLSPLSYRVRGTEHINHNSSAIFIGNHVGSIGPFQAVLTLPVRLYPWAIAEMTDPARIHNYVYAHFIAPIWHLTGWTGALATRLVACIVGNVLRGIDCIPLDRSRNQYVSAFSQSLAVLEQGRSLLIFPENPIGQSDPATHMRPFMPGFIHLCAHFRRKTGSDLPVYPIAVVPPQRIVVVGEARYLCFSEYSSGAIRHMRDSLQDAVGSLYLACLAEG